MTQKPKEGPTNGEKLMKTLGTNMVLTDAEEQDGWVPIWIDEDWWNAPCDPIAEKEGRISALEPCQTDTGERNGYSNEKDV